MRALVRKMVWSIVDPLLGLARGVLEHALRHPRLNTIGQFANRAIGASSRTIDTGVRLAHALRDYQFRDCRLIVEQDDNIHYLLLSAAAQRRASRVAGFLLGGALVLMVGMMVTSALLSHTKTRLERSHEDIYRALLEAYDGSQAGGKSLSDDDMVAIANSIRQRNTEIRRFVDRSVESISDENTQLGEVLNASGLTEKAIRTIQMSTPVGGSNDALSVPARFDQVNALAQVIANNRSLRDVLEELPDHLPLASSTVSSGYGLRVHPISGRTQFHSGVDLVPSSDLLVHPARRGQVVLASYGEEIGNVVIVRHGGGIETRYGHLASIAVREGDEVTERSVLGVVGNTGAATTGRHLHFEVSVGGYPVDPLKVIQAARDVRRIEAQR